jgi:hypothetical protein
MDGYSQRSLGIHAGTQEILVAPDYLDHAAAGRINYVYQRIGAGAFHIHTVLMLWEHQSILSIKTGH